jgi:4-hydroxyphenylpyruvate dioxygenase-like putative hemolysin
VSISIETIYHYGTLISEKIIGIANKRMYYRLLSKDGHVSFTTSNICRVIAALHEQGHIHFKHLKRYYEKDIKEDSKEETKIESEANSFVFRCIKYGHEDKIRVYMNILLRGCEREKHIHKYLSNAHTIAIRCY